MGGKSKSSSSQTSNQESFSQALYGDNSGVMLGGDNNQVSLNVTDHGAIDSALSFADNIGSAAFEANVSANNNLAALSETGFELANEVSSGAFGLVDSITSNQNELANSAMQNTAALASEGFSFANSALENNALLTSEGFSFADSAINSNAMLASDLFGTSAELINQSSERSLDAALAVHNTGLQQLQLGTDFVAQLNQQSLDTSLQAQQDNNDALTNGFKASMQFVEDFSRSDGGAVAETNMKTIGLLSLAAVGVAFAMKKGK
jgi:hypothetical protein